MGLTHQQKRAERDRLKRAGLYKPAPTTRELGERARLALSACRRQHLEAGRLYLLRWRGYAIETTEPTRWEYWLMERGADLEAIEVQSLPSPGV